MERAELLKLSLKGLLAWSVLSGLGWYFGQGLGTSLLGLFGFVIRLADPGYAPSLTLVAENHDFLIRLSAWVLHPLPLGEDIAVPPGRELTAGTHVMHTLVPVVIELSILLVWPVRSWAERLLLLSLGVFGAVLLVGCTGPFVLLGNIEILLQEMAQRANVARPEPWPLTWMLFSEMGGRWLMAIVAAILCIRMQRWVSKRSSSGG